MQSHQYNEMKALVLVIKIGDRLLEDNYTKFYDLHNKKWGELDTTSNKSDIMPDSYEISFSRPKANTEEEKEQERLEMLECYKIDERFKDKDKKLYFSILSKYYEYMWD